MSKHIGMLSKNINLYSPQDKNNVITGDFNARVSDSHMNDF